MIADAELNNLKQRIEALHDIGRYDEALALVMRGLGAAPEDGDLYGYGAMVCSGLPDYERAEEFAAKCIEYQPDEEWGYRLMSIVYVNTGRTELGLEMAETAVSVDPEYPDAVHALAAAQLDNGDIEEAAETAENLRALAPDSADALSLSGSIEFARNDPYAAKEYFTAALRLQPDSFLAMHNLGVAEIHTFNFDEAIEVLRRALELDPVNAGVKQNLDYAVSERDRELRVKLRPYWPPVILLCAYLFTLPLLEANWRLLLPGVIVALLAVGGYFLTFKFRRRQLHPNVQMAVRMHAKTIARDPARRLISDKLMSKLLGLFITTGLIGSLLALYLAAAVLMNSRISELPPILLVAAGTSVLTAAVSGIYIGLRRVIFRRVADLLIKEYRAIKNDGNEEE